jgi:hypothetical protein
VIALNTDAQIVRDWAKIAALVLAKELFLDVAYAGAAARDKDDIINVGENEWAILFALEHTEISFYREKSHSFEVSWELLVPEAWGPTEVVQRLVQVRNVVIWNADVDNLVIIKYTVKKGSCNVCLFTLEIESSNEGKEYFESGSACNSCVRLAPVI